MIFFLAVLTKWKFCTADTIIKEIETNFTFGSSDSTIFTKYELVGPMDKQLELSCTFEESLYCSENFISVSVEGNSMDMVEYCDGNFTETSAFRRMTVLTTLRTIFKCQVKVIDRQREICGASISRRIADGVPAAPNEFPYFVAFYSIECQAVNCGGTLSKLFLAKLNQMSIFN